MPISGNLFMFIKTRNDLREALKIQKISQATFANQYYLDEVDKNAADDESDPLGKHLDRFKKLLAKNDMNDRSPEHLSAYINYFNRAYKTNGIFTQADRHAAWELFVEIDTRVATISLEHGIELAALRSIYQLFELHRDIAKRHGPNCRSYYHITQEYFDNYIRPFSSKWHNKLKDNNNDQFRKELIDLQVEIRSLKSSLEEIIK